MEPLTQPPTLDTWTTIFLLAAAHGFVLSWILFFNKKGNRRANLFLGIFTFLFALTLVDYVGYWSGYNQYFPNLRGFWQFLVLLYGPLLYFYLRSLNEKEVKPPEWLHFMPAIAFFVLKIGVGYQHYFPSRLAYFYFEASLFIGHLSAYAVLCGIFLRKVEDKPRAPQKILLWLFWGFIVSWITYYALVKTSYFELIHDYGISLAMTVFIYAVGYLGLRQSVPAHVISKQKKETISPKYKNSTLTKAASASIAGKLLAHMDSAQPYLDNNLRVGALADRIGVSTHHLSQVLNEELGRSFSELVNEHRVEEAKRLLLDPENENEYIINLAYQAGFNNKTTFNKIFKLSTGTSPSEFRKRARLHQLNGLKVES